jgi:hypothetical protein
VKKIALLLTLSALALTSFALVSTAGEQDQDSVKIAALVNEMNAVSPAKLQTLKAIEPKPYTLPEPGIDVMRARLTETYTIAGVGEDTVELNGWIAVTHGKPSTNDWKTAVTDTQFVGLDLRGESKLFGPVHVTFDPDKPAVGKVGRIDIPGAAKTVLAQADDEGAVTACGAEDSLNGESSETLCVICRAPVSVAVSMPNLGLSMETKVPATWYSVVNTIPPVGHTASVAIEPVPLVTADGREVGTLDSGRVLFRETVRHVGLSQDVDVTTKVAATPSSSPRATAPKK